MRPLSAAIEQVEEQSILPEGAENMRINRSLIWAVISLFGIMTYLIMDGFDHGDFGMGYI
jgi:hypothetical protein